MTHAKPVLVCVVLALWTFAAVATGASPVAAVVNGVQIEPWEVDREFRALLPQSSFHGRVEGDRRLELRQRAIDAIILKELKRQWAIQQGVTIDGSEVNGQLIDIRSRFADEEAYRAVLNENGITEAELRRAIERDQLAEAVDDRILDKVPGPLAGEVERYFESNRADYLTPEARHVVHVLVPVAPSAHAADWERAAEIADTLAAEAREGKLDLMAESGRRRSEVPPRYRDQTGDLGMVHRGALRAPADEAVFAAQIGDVVGPIRTIFGFSVFEVKAVEPPRQLEFDQVREAVSSMLLRERREAAKTGFEAKLTAEATVERGPPFEGR